MSKVRDAVAEIQSVLTRRAKLKAPRFVLEAAGSKVSGSIISETFRGMPDSERQSRIWEALDAEYGPDCAHRVGTLLAFTPDEWDLGDEADASP
jgi:acid stress-induced BolA-like protein IbaG/YrbA